MLWDREKQTPSFKRILFWVASIHVILLSLLRLKDVAMPAKEKPKLIVKSFQEKPAPQKVYLEPVKEMPLEVKKLIKWQEEKEEKNKPNNIKKESIKKEDFEPIKYKPVEKKVVKKIENKKSLPKITLKKESQKKALGKKNSKNGREDFSLKKRLEAKNENLKKQKTLQKLSSFLEDFDKSNNPTIKSSSKELFVPKLRKEEIIQNNNFELSIEGSSSSEIENHELSYLMISYLKEHLNLPEKGAVKVNLIINSEGKVEKAKVIKSESERNKRHILTALNEMSFPFFKGYLKKEKSFIITFLDEENR